VEAGSLIQDPLSVLSFNGFVTETVPPSRYDAWEPFGEVNVPLVHDRPWARDLSLSFSVRWSDFSSFGETTPWQGGLTWQPVEQVRLRANYSQVFRAPTLGELNDPAGISDGQAPDPCGDHPTAAQRANCAADGVPGGAYDQPGDQLFTVIAGGNPDLAPETGHSTSAGITYTPERTEGLSLGIDLYWTVLSGSIGQPSATDVLRECADHGTPTVCDAITRFADGSIKQVAIFNQNFGLFEMRAVDLTIEWHATTRFGELATRLLGSYLERQKEQPFPQGSIFHRAGTFDIGALPHWRASGSIDWRSGPWSAGYAAEYTGHYAEWVQPFPPFDIFFAQYRRDVDAVLYQDVSGGFDFDSGVTVRAVISNVFDEDPPFINSGSIENTDPGTYRLLGRTYFLELKYAFD
jgi:outer membrane receptor protein involved in Fe transport